MSHNHGADSAPPSRRSVVKGAAWAVPAVVVAGAAPTVAASVVPLDFTGNACKLPGNSQSIFKGYVFELTATNPVGDDTGQVFVIESVSVNTTGDTQFAVRTTGTECTCSTCPGSTLHAFCVPDGGDLRVLIYTTEDITGTSINAEMTVVYSIYECGCTPIPSQQHVSIRSGVHSTPPAQGNKCSILDAIPSIPS